MPKSCPTPELSAVSSSLDDTVHSSIPNHRPFSNVHDALEVTEFVESFLANLLADLSIERFDTGANRCMSGNYHPLSTPSEVDGSTTILGFNASHSRPTRYGLNHDQKMEYYVADMPSNLTLFCTNAFSQVGCAVLFAQDGLVLSRTESEVTAIREFIDEYLVVKRLKVANRLMRWINHINHHQILLESILLSMHSTQLPLAILIRTLEFLIRLSEF